MKCRLIFFLLISLLCSDFSSAQVERIGMKGTSDFKILAQLGNVLYATSGDGKNYYRSFDEGDTWFLFIDGLPISSYSYKSTLKTDGDLVYFQEGDGEYRSSNFLNSWTFYKYPKVADTIPQYIFHKGNDTLFTIIYYDMPSKDGFYFSSDKGVHWEKRTLPPNDKVSYSSLTITNKRLLLPSYQLNDTIFRYGIMISDDYGKTWQNVNSGFPDSTTVVISGLNGRAILATGDKGQGYKLYRSTDEGNHWLSINQFMDSGWYSFDIFQHRDKIYLSAEVSLPNLKIIYRRDLFISDDSGKSWSRYFEDTSEILKIYQFFATDNRIFAEGYRGWYHYLILPNGQTTPFFAKSGLYQSMGILYANNSGLYADGLKDSLYISNDNGISWHSRLFIKGYNCESKWLKRDEYLYSFGSSFNDSLHYIFRSSDDGNNWIMYAKLPMKKKLINIVVQGDTIVADFHPFAFMGEGIHYLSIDGGKSWVSIDNIYAPGRLTSQDIGDVTCLGNGTLFAIVGTNYGWNLWHSTDLSASWDSFPIPRGYTISYPLNMMFKENKFYILAYAKDTEGHHYDILQSSNNGFTWIYPKLGFPNNSTLGAFIEFENILYASITKKDYTTIYFSLDQGILWRQHAEPILTTGELFANSKYLFISNQDHLYRIPLQTLSVPSHPNQSANPFLLERINPNPANASVSIHYSLTIPQSKLFLNVFDVMGKLCSSFALPAFQGEHDFNFDVGKYSSGNYTLSLSNGFFDSRQKLEILH
jgi:photosystem II stability/assembly factor-like uncharacterized protein